MIDTALNDKYTREMQALVDKGKVDIEVHHMEADSLLTELLTDLGYYEVVAAYDQIEKGYT